MVNSKQRKIVTIVCIVLGVLLITGGIIGALLYLNSNEYRFREAAFLGEYINIAETSYRDNRITMNVYLKGDEHTGNLVMAEVSKEDDWALVFFDNKADKEISAEQIDPKVLESIKYFAELFGASCNVQKDKMTFGTKNLSIKSSEFVPVYPENIGGPVRKVIAVDESNGTEFVFIFYTDYVRKDNIFITHCVTTEFQMEIYKFYVDGEDGQTYSIKGNVAYFNKIRYENEVKEGVYK